MANATFVGYGQQDSGGQAQPSIKAQTIVWAVSGGSFNNVDLAIGTRGPTNTGVIYTGGGGGTTPGFGQIFPTGRS